VQSRQYLEQDRQLFVIGVLENFTYLTFRRVERWSWRIRHSANGLQHRIALRGLFSRLRLQRQMSRTLLLHRSEDRVDEQQSGYHHKQAGAEPHPVEQHE